MRGLEVDTSRSSTRSSGSFLSATDSVGEHLKDCTSGQEAWAAANSLRVGASTGRPGTEQTMEAVEEEGARLRASATKFSTPERWVTLLVCSRMKLS